MGETVIEPRAVPHSLFILGLGVLRATRQEGGHEVELFRLAPGDCFGEAGAVTAASEPIEISALTKAVTYEISKEDLAAILEERPGIANDLSQILARREALEHERAEEERPEHGMRPENVAERLAERIKSLFHLE